MTAQKLDKQTLIDMYLKAQEEGKEGNYNEQELAGMYLLGNTEFVWDSDWMEEDKDFWKAVQDLVNQYRN